jgi:hypothetical protein
MKWRKKKIHFLPRLNSNIIRKNIVKIFQKFEVKYTSLESGTMWHPKGDHYSVLSPIQELQTQEYSNTID